MRPQGRAAMVISAALVLSAASQAEAGLRTDGLSGRNLKTWRAILAVVQAVASVGRIVFEGGVVKVVSLSRVRIVFRPHASSEELC